MSVKQVLRRAANINKNMLPLNGFMKPRNSYRGNKAGLDKGDHAKRKKLAEKSSIALRG